MSFLFVTRKPLLLSNLSNSEKVIFIADKPTSIKNIIICNRTDSSMKISLRLENPETIPVEKAYIHDQTQLTARPANTDLCILNPSRDKTKASNERIDGLDLTVGCKLFCYSNGSKEFFDLAMFYAELNETEELI